jgi:hypothetical protein
MQEMGEGSNLIGGLLRQLGILGYGSGRKGVGFVGLRLHGADVHAESGQDLADVVVQFAGQPATFVALHLQKRGG